MMLSAIQQLTKITPLFAGVSSTRYTGQFIYYLFSVPIKFSNIVITSYFLPSFAFYKEYYVVLDDAKPIALIPHNYVIRHCVHSFSTLICAVFWELDF